MQKPKLHFAHANGFPSKSYSKLFSFLEPHFDVGYISIHGHNPDYPVTNNWTELANELIHYIEKHYTQPVIGVGHSLGGVLTFMAALTKPELFSSIIMLDAPVLNPLRSVGVRLAKKYGWIDKLTPGGVTRARRREWPSVEAAIEYFANKSVFKHFDADCLHDYVRYSTEKTEQGIRLIFTPEIEYQIYRTLPDHLSQYRKRLKVPASLIYGKRASAVTASDRSYMKKHFHIHCESIEGDHLFPFEHPELTAQRIKMLAVNL